MRVIGGNPAMTNLKQTLQTALKEAMKARDKNRRDAIRLLQSAVKQAEIDSRAELDNDAVMNILQKEAKKRREAIAELEAADRPAAAANEKNELAIIEDFLPQQMTAAELKPIIQAAIAQIGADSTKQMGQVMKIVMPKVSGLADGRQVSAIVRELLD